MCIVNDRPFLASFMGRDGRPYVSSFHPSFSDQLMGEGIMATAVFALGALSLIAAIYLIISDK